MGEYRDVRADPIKADKGAFLRMHPFYGPNSRLLEGRGSAVGLASMMAYLAFWAAVVGIAMKTLNERFPKAVPKPALQDAAVAALRERFARGEIDEAEFLSVKQALDRSR
ncbi:MAG: SHOCT domain-containing protein [Candidatus Nanopelagicales bacterium]